MQRPDRVFSKGGYVSVPVILSAWILHIPVIIHESDIRPGLATRLGAKFASHICISWESSRQYFPGKQNISFSGIPVDDSLLQGNAETPRRVHGFDAKPILLIMGGSLGAQAINTLIWTHLHVLLENWNITHLTGRGKLNTALSGTMGYTQLEFIREELADTLASAEVIISRAGATALAEFEYLGKKVLMIPLPLRSSRGDQIDNGREFHERYPKSTQLIMEEEVTWGKVETSIDFLAMAPIPSPQMSCAVTCIVPILVA